MMSHNTPDPPLEQSTKMSHNPHLTPLAMPGDGLLKLLTALALLLQSYDNSKDQA